MARFPKPLGDEFVVSREWRRADIAILRGRDVVAQIEAKSMYSFDVFQHGGRQAYLKRMIADAVKMSALARSDRYLLSTVTDVRGSISEDVRQYVVKYSPMIARAAAAHGSGAVQHLGRQRWMSDLRETFGVGDLLVGASLRRQLDCACMPSRGEGSVAVPAGDHGKSCPGAHMVIVCRGAGRSRSLSGKLLALCCTSRSFRRTAGDGYGHSVQVPFMTMLEKRWDARQTGLELLTVTTSVDLIAAPDEVWSFVSDPRCQMLINPDVIKSFHVPGTPEDEVGQQHCVILNIGGRLVAHISELIAVDIPHRLVARWPTMATDVLSTMLLKADEGRTLLTYQLGMCVEAGTGKKQETGIKARMADELERVRAAFESGARFLGS